MLRVCFCVYVVCVLSCQLLVGNQAVSLFYTILSYSLLSPCKPVFCWSARGVAWISRFMVLVRAVRDLCEKTTSAVKGSMALTSSARV